VALQIPKAILEQIEKIPDEQWMPRRVASTEDIAEVLRTPEARFEGLPGYPFEPSYLETPLRYGQSLRMHYVDEGPRDAAETLLCLHGEPTWSYLYRHMIPILAGAGVRVVAPDLIGFGKSDKPADRRDYTFERHVRWVCDLVEGLDLTDITLFGQDWGGLIGLRTLCALPERFARAVASNTGLPGPDYQEASPDESGPTTQAFLIWLRVRLIVPSWAEMIRGSMRTKTLTDAEAAAYEAPFPDERYKAGSREFPGLAPLWRGYPSTVECAEAWNRVLGHWDKPFLTAWGEDDDVFPLPDSQKALTARIPGCKGQVHTSFPSGHFTQEEQGPLLAQIVRDFMKANPLPV
jgi:haloalkane dehalogenase